MTLVYLRGDGWYAISRTCTNKVTFVSIGDGVDEITRSREKR